MARLPSNRRRAGVLTPGRWLMDRLRMPVKLSLLAMCVMVPLVLAMILLVRYLAQETQVANRATVGIDAASAVFVVVEHLNEHQMALIARQLQLPDSEARLQASAQALRGAASALERSLADPLLAPLSKSWPSKRSQLEALITESPRAADLGRALHGEAMVGFRLWVEAINDLTRFGAVAPEDIRPVIQFMVLRTLQWTGQATEMHGLSLQASAVADGPSPAQVAQLTTLAQAQAAEAGYLSARANALAEMGHRIGPDVRGALSAINAQIGRVNGLMAPSDARPSAQALDAAGREVNQSLGRLAAGASDRLAATLSQRSATLTTQIVVLVCVVVLGLAVLAYGIWSLSATTVGNLNGLLRVMREAADGNLATKIRIAPGARDELARVMHEFERMMDRLSQLVAEVRNSAILVGDVGEQLVKDSGQLSRRTQSQAESLQHTTKHVRGVGNTVQRNSDAAQEVSLMTKHLHKETEQAGTQMGAMVQSMQALNDTSRSMNEIIGTIESIAFQTNLLALNAAVEAARAGEQGRGFAVVAAEVRGLSQRTQKAAAQVRQLIATSSVRVESSVAQISSVSEIVQSLITSIREVALNIDVMADASSRQSESLAQVVQAVGDLDSVTEENSVLVERTSHRSMRLIQRSQRLQEAVSHVRLRQGTADEARELCQRAAELIERAGLDAAFDTLHDPEGEFIDRDMYVSVFDSDGTYHAFSARVEQVGANMADVPGRDTPAFLEDARHRVEAGGGWVDYITLDLSGQPRNKTSYVVGLSSGLMVSVGVYQPAA
jgi:methyl-accepting chemotaxis protein